MKKVLLFIIPFSIIFLAIKMPHLSIRLSDTNVYFYTAFEILNQEILYKDIFFTNFPVFPYISSFYQLATFGNVNFFYATALIEAVTATALIFYIVYKKTKNTLTASISSLLYISSTVVLISSDHQIGVFTAVIFMLLSYIFLQKNKFFLSGVLISLCILTKAYFLPIAISFAIYLLLIKKDRKVFINFCAGFIATSVLILLPFILFSGKEFLTDVFYSATRGGVTKTGMLIYFAGYDFVMFTVFVFNIFNFKKHPMFSIISLSSIVFFIFYNGWYYVYLNFLIPILAISFSNFSKFLIEKNHYLKNLVTIFIVLLIAANITLYFFNYSGLYKMISTDDVIKIIKKENPDFLYGTADFAPIVSYLSEKPLLDGFIDTNPNVFKKGFLDKKDLTQKAIDSKSIIVARGYNNTIVDKILDKNLIDKNCRILKSYPVSTGEKVNQIILFKCY